MKGDFTRSTFRVENHYSSVRMQQGRLQLDADWNEQVDIQRHLLQMQARDMIGQTGVSLADLSTALSFQIGVTDDGQDLTIAPGRIYVDGVLCELEPATSLDFTLKPSSSRAFSRRENGNQMTDNKIEIEVPTLLLDGQDLAAEQWIELVAATPSSDPEAEKTPVRVRIDTVDPTPRKSGFTITFKQPTVALPESGKLRRILTWKTQPDYPQPDYLKRFHPTPGKTYLAYLDVWQRHLTAIEDPRLREPALNIPDTATRTKTVWQVKLLDLGIHPSLVHFPKDPSDTEPENPSEADRQQALTGLNPPNAALIARVSPGLSQGGTSSARRLENQLYRVEIHTGGKGDRATFKWSRDNGTIVSAIADLEDGNANVITITPTGRDGSQLFAPNQWVEITDDVRELQEIPGTLVRLTAATAGTRLVFQKARDSDPVNRAQFPRQYNPKVRRWDHRTSMAEIPTVGDQWIPLGDEGIEVWFGKDLDYKTGDYWLIPARTVTNTIEWTRDSAGNPLPQTMDGPFHAYSRLAVLTCGEDGKFKLEKDDRRQFAGLAETLPLVGGTITGKLTVEKTLHARQDLIVGKTLTVNSGQITGPGDLSLKTKDQNRLTINNSTGNVGIGISIPFSKLHVAVPADQTQTLRLSQGDRYVDMGTSDISANLPTTLVQFQTNCKGYQFDEDIKVTTGGIGSINAQHLFLRTGNTTRITVLQDNGNVGIGTDTPFTKLHVAAAPAETPVIRLSQGDGYVDLGLHPDQSVGFQTSGLGYKFDKPLRLNRGDRSVDLGLRSDHFVGFQTTGLGYKFDKPIVHTGSPQVSSSRTLKENIVELDRQEAIDLLQALRPVKFTHRADQSKQIQAGFLAEEVPALVASTDRQAIQLMEIIAILTQNVKNHEQTIAALTQQVARQQAMIDSLLGDVLEMWIANLD